MSDLGDFVAVYAAAVSSWIGLRTWRRERNPLRLALDFVEYFEEDDPDLPLMFRLRIVNLHDGPITVDTFGIGFAIDYRRLPEVFFGLPAGGYAASHKKVKLGPYESADALFDQAVIDDRLRGELVLGTVVNERGQTVDDWQGRPPLRLDHLWAVDVAGHRYRRRLGREWRQYGYESIGFHGMPIVRGRAAASWLRIRSSFR